MRREQRRRGARASPIALAAAALGLAATGCSTDDGSPYFGATARVGKDRATFYVNNGAEPETLDPGRCNEGAGTALVSQMFEGLTTRDPKSLRPSQAVATRWEQSRDSRLFRFHLRSDARWSDGAPVTAFDFDYAWKRVLRPATASVAVANLYPLKNAKLFNEGKLKVVARALTLRAAPREGARIEEGCRLERGTAVQILAREGGAVLVRRHDDLPTFATTAAKVAGARAAAEPRGYVDERDLEEDPSVVGVRATDAQTLEVELEQPTPYFTELTSYPTLYPVRRDVIEAFARRGEEELWIRPGNIVTNGPYTLDAWRFRYEITMTRSPFYWNRDALKIHRIVWLAVEDYHATMNLYKTGEIDYVGDNLALPAEYQARLREKRDYRNFDYLGVYWYEINTRRPPLDDARVRRALDLAIDKQQLVLRVTRGGQRPATHFVPDFTGHGYAEVAARDRSSGVDPFAAGAFDPERARALLAEAGYAVDRVGDGYLARGLPPIEVLYNHGEGQKLIAVAIQDMWRRNLGVTANLRSEEWKVMLQNYRDGRFQVMRSGWQAEYDHPNTFLDTFRSDSPQNETGWRDPSFDAALRRAAATADPEASIRRYREAEAIAVAAMPRLPLYFYTRSTLCKPWVHGFYGAAHGVHQVQFLSIGEGPATSGGDDAPAFSPLPFPPPGEFTPEATGAFGHEAAP